MANHPHLPTEKSRGMAQGLAGFGIEQSAIAAELGISDRTLRKHYKKELAAGTPRLIAKLAASLTKRALDPSGGMASTVANIFMLKTRGRWRESQVIEHTGADGEPMQGSQTVNIYEMSTLSLPNNGRDPDLARPMKTIEHQPMAAKTAA
jgi:hypothetical protein